MKLLIAAQFSFPLLCSDRISNVRKDISLMPGRCVTQRMADYISCVEASGGNRQEITEEVSEIGGAESICGRQGVRKWRRSQGVGELASGQSIGKDLGKKMGNPMVPKGYE